MIKKYFLHNIKSIRASGIMRNLIALTGIAMILSSDLSAQSGSGRQDSAPIRWDTYLEKENDSIYQLVFKATIEDGWHLYSQEKAGNSGPIPTKFTFKESSEKYDLCGKTTEPEAKAMFEPIFGISIKSFEHEAEFKQCLKAKADEEFIVEAEVRFMLCDNYKCRAPETFKFQFVLNKQ